jgi:hypothetical protein
MISEFHYNQLIYFLNDEQETIRYVPVKLL